MAEKILTHKGEPKAVGLHGLIEEFDLKVPLPAVRSEVISGARRTTVTDGTVLEQYPKGYLPVGVTGNLRFAMRYEPIDLSALAAIFDVLDIGAFQNWVRSEPTGIFARRASLRRVGVAKSATRPWLWTRPAEASSGCTEPPRA